MMKKEAIADLILEKLEAEQESIAESFSNSREGIGYFMVDNLLPAELAREIHQAFPAKEDMVCKKSMREYKYVAAQMDQYNPLLEEVIYAFQDRRIVDFIGDLCKIDRLEPDENLYAGGISLMAEGNFLNPHLDNSHDKDRERWRILNLLYYVTPDWEDANGGHLEVWPNGLKQPQTVIHSRFNRLAVMATHKNSWHSVSPVVTEGSRCCVSNYYFSKEPLRESDSFHVTSFRARPGQKVKDFVLDMDSRLRMMIRKVFKKGIRENPHRYKKDDTAGDS